MKGARRILSAFESLAPDRIALALGETYDPNMLAAWGTRNERSDADKARSYYRKALGLGVARAKTRLDNLHIPEGGEWAAHPPAPLMSAEDWARADRLLKQGTRRFERGEVAAARGLFEYVYQMGLAAGALKMAATFDPHELAHLKVRVEPNREEARLWYERARDMGHPEAEDKLDRLARSRP